MVRKFLELELDDEEHALLKAIAALNNSDGSDLDNFGICSVGAQAKPSKHPQDTSLSGPNSGSTSYRIASMRHSTSTARAGGADM